MTWTVVERRQAKVIDYQPEDLTIAICTVDRPTLLKACLESLLHTTPAGVALCVVFNGTPASGFGEAQTLIDKWDGPTQVARLPEMVSLDESHNHALAMVSTPLVNFMGDDDLVLGSRVPLILKAFNTLEPTPLVVTTFARRMAGVDEVPKLGSNKDLGPASIAEWREWSESGRIFEMLWPGAVLSVEALRSIGGFEKRFNHATDNWIFSRLAMEGPVLSLPDRNFGYRIHAGSLSSSNWRLQTQHVRYVAACYRACRLGRGQPDFETFLADEARAPRLVNSARNLRDLSRIRFRRGGALTLSGHRIAGALNIASSALLWPPAFLEKVQDQFGR